MESDKMTTKDIKLQISSGNDVMSGTVGVEFQGPQNGGLSRATGVDIPALPKPKLPFESFVDGTWHAAAPVPPFSKPMRDEYESFGYTRDKKDEDGNYFWPFGCYVDPSNFPVSCHFVLDNKWVLYNEQKVSLQILTLHHPHNRHSQFGQGEWKVLSMGLFGKTSL